MAEWFFHNGQQQAGPLDDAAARNFARANPGAHCWREGFVDWLPVGQVAELYGGTASSPRRPRRAAAASGAPSPGAATPSPRPRRVRPVPWTTPSTAMRCSMWR
ncbi:DUF4339 domain-containing protein [Nitrospirillum sp. BR 11752]|uniref:DUF4339 domain-containing protein n=1 Tax=Nitrospirillum sp. BR 11752 TaxID=3104293 RepID=UPI003FA61046